MRLYKYNTTGIEITDAILDKESIGVIMKNKQIFKPEISPTDSTCIKKAILFVNTNFTYKLEIY
jgi:hypothetical protein